jgi:5-hydroxyisourate hydrolase-like protein (transthyretin family)
LRVVLRRAEAAAVLADVATNADCGVSPLPEGEAFKRGSYEVAFHVGDFFARAAPRSPTRRFSTWCRCAFLLTAPATRTCRC